MKEKQIKLFKNLFILAALWNLIGAIFGYFNTELTFLNFFGRELTDPLIFSIYQGAWGTTLVYIIGYFIVARNPVRHSGIVIVGGIGKVGYVMKLMQLYFSGLANPVVWIVIVGDVLFALFFLYYFIQLYRAKESLI